MQGFIKLIVIMKNLTTLILTLIICLQINAQKKYSFGFGFGVGKNFYNNNLETDKNHFKFNNPSSFNISSQFINHLDEKNKIVLSLGYTNKKISLEYSLNEQNIPITLNENIIEKYNSLQLATGYRKDIKIKKTNIFAEIDLTFDYNTNSALASIGNSNGRGNEPNPNVSLENPVTFNSQSINNLGKKSFTIGTNLSTGIYIGKKQRNEISFNINIPFNNIQNKTSSLTYEWNYLGRNYVHTIKYKGKIIFPYLKFTYYVFEK